MINIVIHLAAAMMCINGHCYPVLVGRGSHPTPTGVYTVHLRRTNKPGYPTGTVLVFDDRGSDVVSIHGVWTGHPYERRRWRIAHGNAAQRHISYGCVNVKLPVYKYLKTACATGCKVRIKK